MCYHRCFPGFLPRGICFTGSLVLLKQRFSPLWVLLFFSSFSSPQRGCSRGFGLPWGESRSRGPAQRRDRKHRALAQQLRLPGSSSGGAFPAFGCLCWCGRLWVCSYVAVICCYLFYSCPLPLSLLLTVLFSLLSVDISFITGGKGLAGIKAEVTHFRLPTSLNCLKTIYLYVTIVALKCISVTDDHSLLCWLLEIIPV